MAKGELAKGKRQVACVVNEDLLARIDAFAERSNMTRSQVLYMSLGLGFETYEQFEKLGLGMPLLRRYLKFEKAAVERVMAWRQLLKSRGECDIESGDSQ